MCKGGLSLHHHHHDLTSHQLHVHQILRKCQSPEKTEELKSKVPSLWEPGREYHTSRNVRFLSKKSIMTKYLTFRHIWIFVPKSKMFLNISISKALNYLSFRAKNLRNLNLKTSKKPIQFDDFLGETAKFWKFFVYFESDFPKMEFLDKKWRFRTVWREPWRGDLSNFF